MGSPNNQNSFTSLGKQIVLLTGPIFIANLSGSLSTFLLTLVAAQLGQTVLAGMGLANTYSLTIFLVAIGVINSCGIAVAHAFGAKNQKEISYIVGQGYWLAIGITLPIIACFYFASPILLALGQEPAIVKQTQIYLNILIVGAIPFALFCTFFQYIVGIGLKSFVMLSSITAAILSVSLGSIFGLGLLGMPAYGLKGVAWSVVAVDYLMLIITAGMAYAYPLCREYKINYYFTKPDFSKITELLKLGLPIGGLWSLEFGEFFMASLFAGWLGEMSLAAYQITMQLSLVVYMLPLALSEASMILVGQAIGARDKLKTLAVTKASTNVCWIMSIGLAIILFFGSHLITTVILGNNAAYTSELLHVTDRLLKIVALVMIFDSLRINFSGILRGFKDTRFAMIAGLMSFWVVAIPSGYVLAFVLQIGIYGLWYGTLIGVTFGLTILYARLRHCITKNI